MSFFITAQFGAKYNGHLPLGYCKKSLLRLIVAIEKKRIILTATDGEVVQPGGLVRQIPESNASDGFAVFAQYFEEHFVLSNLLGFNFRGILYFASEGFGSALMLFGMNRYIQFRNLDLQTQT